MKKMKNKKSTKKKKTTSKKKIPNKKTKSKKKTKGKSVKKESAKKTSKKDKEIKETLNKIIDEITPEEKLINNHEKEIKNFINKIEKRIKKLNINAEVFLGGSFAKNTVVKKEKYDADIFIRFSKEYKNISKITKKILKGIKKQKVHGSRDYYRVRARKNFIIEVVPVLMINSPEEAENVTDLSYEHVNYINKKIKTKEILDEIKLAKSFCEANKYYGAESYINGFSGYALELLIIHYGSFLEFIKDMAKLKQGNQKLIIDIEKKYKNKNEIAFDLNQSKIQSPIILIDPTYKKRNSLAALSYETFENFKKTCKDFLEAQNKEKIKYFKKHKTNLKKVKKQSKKQDLNFILLEAKTNKQSGDIAGTKLSKFYKHLREEISKYFEIYNKGFNYDMKHSSKFFFVLKPKKEIIFMGPPVGDKENVKKFKKQHENVLQKRGRFYALEKVTNNPQEFIKNWKKSNKRKLKEMSIKKLKVLE